MHNIHSTVRNAFYIALLLSLLIPLGAKSISSSTYAQSPEENFPRLEIATAVRLNLAESPVVKVPVYFEPNGHDIVAAGFSIRYDATCLALIDSDLDGNNILDGVKTMFDPQFLTYFSYDSEDLDGQFAVVAIDYSAPRATLKRGTILELIFRPTCMPASHEVRVANVGFGSSPPPSFSNAELSSEKVHLIDGSVEISSGATGTTTLPPVDGSAEPPDDATREEPDVSPEPIVQLPPIVFVPGNQPPLAIEDTVVTDEDMPVSFDPTSNDLDPDSTELYLGAIIVEPRSGTATLTGKEQIRYTPNQNFNGSDSLVYFLLDGNGGTTTGLVTITINPVNDVPTFTGLPLEFSSKEGEPVSLKISAVDQEVSPAMLSYRIFGLPYGTNFDTETGQISGAAAMGARGSYDIIAFVSDGSAEGNTAFLWNVLSSDSDATADVYLPIVSNQ